MAASALCKLSIGSGTNKITLEHRLTASLRKNSSISTRQAERKDFGSCLSVQKCFDKSSPVTMRPKNGSFGDFLKCKAVVNAAPVEEGNTAVAHAPAPVEEGNAAPVVEELSRSTLIWRAAKIPLYTVAVSPVIVGCAAAYYQTGQFSILRAFAMLLSNIAINIWVKVSNDVYDYDTGADKNKKESVINLFGSRTLFSVIAWSALVVGSLGQIGLAALAGNPRSVVLLAASIFGIFLYQCPPYRLSYYGVGEPLLFLAYGPLPTIGFYLLNSAKSELAISGLITWSSILVGLTTSLILFCSHFHQIKDDKAVGKMSPLVRLGTETGSTVVKFSVVGFYGVLFALGIAQVLPLATVATALLTLPIANAAVSFIETNHRDNSKIFMAKYFFVKLHSSFGIALAAGLVLARMLARDQLPKAIGL